MTHRRTTRSRSGFTLLELLIVIGIITLLVGVLLAVGLRAIRSQDERATKNVLISLDRALSEYILVAGSIPKYNPLAYSRVPGPDLLDPNDGLNIATSDRAFLAYPVGSTVRHPIRPDAAVFTKQVSGYGEVDAIIRGIPERFLVSTVTGPESDPVAGDPSPSVIDAWAIVDALWPAPHPIARQQLIYYVHPENELAQDLYGRCVNGRPYFMSAGPDRRYGLTSEFADQNLSAAAEREAALKALEDNIYSYTPGPVKKDMSQR